MNQTQTAVFAMRICIHTKKILMTVQQNNYADTLCPAGEYKTHPDTLSDCAFSAMAKSAELFLQNCDIAHDHKNHDNALLEVTAFAAENFDLPEYDDSEILKFISTITQKYKPPVQKIV